MPSESDSSHQWYIVHTLSGQEAKVLASLMERVEVAGLKEDVSEILVPTEKVEGVLGGAPARRTLYPGYILVKTSMSEPVWRLIKATPKITGFFGGSKPTPLSDEEVRSIVGRTADGRDVRTPVVHYDIGEIVRVVDGPFANFAAEVQADDRERGVLRLSVKIADRVTLIEARYSQVEKA